LSADPHGAVAAAPHGGHGHEHHDPTLAHHFDSMEQQTEATTLGMWVFLVTEIMFFGGVFCAYMVYRMHDPAAFAAGSHHLDILLGGFNTVVLIVSSLTMAFAVRQAALGDRKTYVPAIVATMVLGATFLVVKYFEYKEKFTHHLVPGAKFHWPDAMLQNGVEMFYSIYFFMTGLHALHMIVGLALLTVILVEGAKAATYTARFKARVETMGLYWHFVDIVWIFLFPLLYLLGRH
jgi:cytochrome c oxidase subunit 3